MEKERREQVIESASDGRKKISEMSILEMTDTLSENVKFVHGIIDLMQDNVHNEGSLDEIENLAWILSDARSRLGIVDDLAQEIWERQNPVEKK